MITLRYPSYFIPSRAEASSSTHRRNFLVVCAAKGPRPRLPRVWKSKKKIGTISKSAKFVDCIKGLSNVKEEVYGALDSFIAWELEFPLIMVKKALKTLEYQKEWKRMIQVIKWMLSKGQGKTMGTYYSLLDALVEDGRLEEAEELWRKVFSENLESLPRIFYTKMISIYHRRRMHENMFEIFADMEELRIRPEMAVVNMIGEVFQELGMLDKLEKLKKKYPPPKWEYRYIKGQRVRIRVKQLEEQNASRGPDPELDVATEVIVGTEEDESQNMNSKPDPKLDAAGEVTRSTEVDEENSDIEFLGKDGCESVEGVPDFL